jgi:hypothetical protein
MGLGLIAVFCLLGAGVYLMSLSNVMKPRKSEHSKIAAAVKDADFLE